MSRCNIIHDHSGFGIPIIHGCLKFIRQMSTGLLGLHVVHTEQSTGSHATSYAINCVHVAVPVHVYCMRALIANAATIERNLS